MTKTHEETRRGTLAELAGWAADGVRGEITLVIAGAPKAIADADPEALAVAVQARERAGTDRKAAIAEVAQETGLPKRIVYAAVVAAR
jgi:16S rRNA (cytidine1402-2'-O)-methyltransferase